MPTIKTEAQQQADASNSAQAAEAAAAEAMAAQARGETPPKTVDNNKVDSGEEVESPHTEDEWSSLLDDGDDVGTEDNPISNTEAEVPEEPVVEPPAAEEPVAESEEPPVAEEPTPEVVEEPVAETPEEPEVEIPPVEDTQPEVTQTPEEVQAAVTKAREDARSKLTEQFKLTEEQADNLISDPNTVLPQLAADLYLDLFDSMMQGLQTQVPAMIQNYQRQQEVRQAADKAFYGAWPQLAKPEYRQVIDRIASTYQQLNPTADAEKAVKEIGAQAWVALRLPIDELVRITNAGQETVETPPATPPANVSHIPANSGGTRIETPKPELNEFGELAEEFLIEDKL